MLLLELALYSQQQSDARSLERAEGLLQVQHPTTPSSGQPPFCYCTAGSSTGQQGHAAQLPVQPAVLPASPIHRGGVETQGQQWAERQEQQGSPAGHQALGSAAPNAVNVFLSIISWVQAPSASSLPGLFLGNNWSNVPFTLPKTPSSWLFMKDGRKEAYLSADGDEKICPAAEPQFAGSIGMQMMQKSLQRGKFYSFGTKEPILQTAFMHSQSYRMDSIYSFHSNITAFDSKNNRIRHRWAC